MSCALFGKTPSKRDFIAPGAPRGFLSVWEPWMQAGLSSSKLSLDRQWQERFLTAPIWRFWLGPALCGAAQLGAFMPSLDGIGRYYPLTVLATPQGGEAYAPPEIDLYADWFAAAEDFLLATLEPAEDFDTITARLAALAMPAPHAFGGACEGQSRIARNTLFAAPEAGVSSDMFAAMRAADWLSVHAGRSYWWTQGGGGFAAQALGASGMPPPELFGGFLTGDFGVNLQPALT